MLVSSVPVLMVTGSGLALFLRCPRPKNPGENANSTRYNFEA
jgi:hypothetical protein